MVELKFLTELPNNILPYLLLTEGDSLPNLNAKNSHGIFPTYIKADYNSHF